MQTRDTIKRFLTLWKRTPGQNPASRRAQPIENVASEAQRLPPQSQHSPHKWSTCLLAIIHRLSQPLTALRGSLELALLTERSAAEYRLALTDSLAQADRLFWLLNSLRELTESEDPGEITERIRLDDLMSEVIEELQPLANMRRLSMIRELQHEVFVRGNSRRLRQALFRVIHHAMARGPEYATVRVVLSTLDLSARLMVADEGLAAGPQELDHLGQDSSLGRLFSEASKRGTMEWAIAKRLFEAQGGRVFVESQRTGGCCFWAFLRLASPGKS